MDMRVWMWLAASAALALFGVAVILVVSGSERRQEMSINFLGFSAALFMATMIAVVWKIVLG